MIGAFCPRGNCMHPIRNLSDDGEWIVCVDCGRQLTRASHPPSFWEVFFGTPPPGWSAGKWEVVELDCDKLRAQLSTATAILKRLVDCAERTVQESRREFARGDILDVDMLEDAAIAARAFVEAADTPTRRADQT